MFRFNFFIVKYNFSKFEITLTPRLIFLGSIKKVLSLYKAVFPFIFSDYLISSNLSRLIIATANNEDSL